MSNSNTDLNILIGVELENLDKLVGSSGKSLQDVLTGALDKQRKLDNPNTSIQGLLQQAGTPTQQFQFVQQLTKTFDKAAKEQEALAERNHRRTLIQQERELRIKMMQHRLDNMGKPPASTTAAYQPRRVGEEYVHNNNARDFSRFAIAGSQGMRHIAASGGTESSMYGAAATALGNIPNPWAQMGAEALRWGEYSASRRELWRGARHKAFRDAGASGRAALYATTMSDLGDPLSPHSYGMSMDETANLLQQFGKASGRYGIHSVGQSIRGGNYYGVSKQIEQLMGVQGKLGLGNEAIGLIGATEKAGAISEDQTLLPAAIGLAVSSGLTRGRFGEMFEVLTKSISRIATGVANVKAVQTQEAFISTMGSQYIGNTAARSAAQDTLATLASGGSSLSKYLAVSAGGFGQGTAYWEAVGKMDIGLNAEGGLTPEGILSAVDRFPMVRAAFESNNEGSMRAMSNWLASNTGTRPALVYDTLRAYFKGGMGRAQKNVKGAAGMGNKYLAGTKMPSRDIADAQGKFKSEYMEQQAISYTWDGYLPENLERFTPALDEAGGVGVSPGDSTEWDWYHREKNPTAVGPNKGTSKKAPVKNKNGSISVGGAPGIHEGGLRNSGVFEPDLMRSILEASQELGFNPDWLSTAIRLERGVDKKTGKLNQAEWRRKKGLIGLLPGTAEWLGTSPDELAGMSDVEQMEYTKKYFQKHGWDAQGKNPIKSFEDMYAAIFFGNSGMKAGKDDPLFSLEKNPEMYKANNGRLYGLPNNNMQTDTNADGVVTRGEIDAIAQSVFKAGQKSITLRVEIVDGRVNVLENTPDPMTGASSTIFSIPVE